MKCDYNIYALSVQSAEHFVIEKVGSTFNVYNINTDKDNTSCELINSDHNILDMINFVEIETIPKTTSFMLKNSRWKYEDATEAQLNAIKYAIVKSKWEGTYLF